MLYIMAPLSTTTKIAIYSFPYVDKPRFLTTSALLTYARGWPFCNKTAPMPKLEASVSIANCLENLEEPKLGPRQEIV
jgi:hypothetical protein